MPLSFIRLLALTLALVVPVQGVAAVTAGLCMAFGHHDDVVQTEEGGGGHEHATHSHGDEAADKNDAKDRHCGPCTACCASASISGAVALSVVAVPAHPAYVFSQYPPLGDQPSGLYRPPLAL